MLHKEIPFIRLLVPLCLGIVTGYLTSTPLICFYLLSILSVVLLLLTLLRKTIHPDKLFGIAASLLLFAAGSVLINREMNRPSVIEENEALFICRVKSYPDKRTASYAITAEILERVDQQGERTAPYGRLMLYYTTDDTMSPDLIPGDIIAITTTPRPISNRGNPGEFDYKTFMLKRETRYYAFIRDNSVYLHKQDNKKTIREKALITGNKISQLYLKAGIKPRNATLLSALTLGRKEMIDQETRDSFAKAGVMHVMAVSGLHAGVISMFVFGILFFLKGRLTILRVLISVAVLWSFAFITGLPPSVERASLMFTFLHAGKLLRREVNSINSILAAAFLMLLLKPSDLTQLSFQLSFSAVIFISAFFSKANKVLKTGILPVDRITQIAIVSVLAQLGTMPFTLNAFGRFPVWFLPANIIIIPLASVIIILAVILIILSPLTALTTMVASIINFLLQITTTAVQFIAQLPDGGVADATISQGGTFTLLLFNFTLLYTLFRRREKNLLLPLIALIPLLTVSLVRHINTVRSSEIIIYNTPDHSPVIGMRSGRTLYLLQYEEDNGNQITSRETDIAPDNAVLRHISINRLRPEFISLTEKPAVMVFAGIKILFSEQLYPGIIDNHSPDIIILSKTEGEIMEKEQAFGGVIVTGTSVREHHLNRSPINSLTEADIHPVNTMGAFRIKGSTSLMSASVREYLTDFPLNSQ